VLKDELPYTRFKLKNYGEFEVYGFGEHIAIDASLAILAALQELPLEQVKQNLKNYKGIQKRFDVVYKDQNISIIDDYAHHPTEIYATISSALTYAKLSAKDKLTAIWQPHKYSRTVNNIEGFKKCFRGCDELIILPVWAAGEDEIRIDFEKEFSEYNLTMADSIDGNRVYKNNQEIKRIDSGVILGLGAGDITYQIRGEL